jgi:hypothetical protein
MQTWFQHRRRKERLSASHAASPTAAKPKPADGPMLPQPVSSPALAGNGNHAAAYDEDAEGHDDVDPAKLDAGDRQRLLEYRELLMAARHTLPVPYREDGPPLGIEFDDIPTTPAFPAYPQIAKTKRRKTAEEDPDFEVGAKRQRGSQHRGTSADVDSMDMSALAQQEARAALAAERAQLQLQRMEATIQKEREKFLREQNKADARMAKERERELLRLEAERRKHLERLLREQRKEEERRAKEAARRAAMAEREERRLAAARERELKAEEKRRERLEKHGGDRRGRQGPKDDTQLEWEVISAAYRAAVKLPLHVPVPEEGMPGPDGYPPLPSRPRFPPDAVPLEPAAPAGLQPPDIFGTLLASWAMMNTFSDVLGLPSTLSLDALLEALGMGSASSLVAEVHIALLRLLQADAEEAHAMGEGSRDADIRAQREREAAGVHVISAGGRLVEEALAWGFDIDTWRAHVNALTWPEVARQLAIAAGLGRKRPKTRRRRGRGSGVPHDKDGRMGVEGEDCFVVGDHMMLRMPERLGANTVKGAAWQVLKDAGADGMRVDAIAELIQARGLRDLRTSKTPETSVSGALARDVLFIRVKPATFALQSIWKHYEKLKLPGPTEQDEDADEEDEESESLDGDKPDGGEEAAVEVEAAVQNAEGDEDGGKKRNVDAGESREGKRGRKTRRTSRNSKVAEDIERAEKGEDGAAENQGEALHGEDHDSPQDDDTNNNADNGDNDADGDAEEGEEDEGEDDAAEEARRLRDEAHAGEPWVSALRDGEYDSLSMELRVSLLGALCQLALESPTIRDVLEWRTEEQQRLKKMAWEEPRLEASFLKQQRMQEQMEKMKAQAEAAQREAAKYRALQSGGLPNANNNNGSNADAATVANKPDEPQRQQRDSDAALASGDAANGVDGVSNASPSTAVVPLVDIASIEKEIRKRAQLRHKTVQRGLQAAVIRMEPLGMDRRYNRYWIFAFDEESSNGIGGAVKQQQQQQQEGKRVACAGRVFIESDQDGSLRVLRTPEALEALMASLNRRWPREGALYAALSRYKPDILNAMPAAQLTLPSETTAATRWESNVVARAYELAAASSRSAAIDVKEEANDDSIKKEPGVKVESSQGGDVAPPPLTPYLKGETAVMTKLKSDMLAIAASVPAHALNEFDPGSWKESVRGAVDFEALRVALGCLETAIDEDHLHPSFAKEPVLVRGAWMPPSEELLRASAGSPKNDTTTVAAAATGGRGGTGAEECDHDENPVAERVLLEDDVELRRAGGASSPSDGSRPDALAWLPPTASALALRLCALDAALTYDDGAATARATLRGYTHVQRPGRLPGSIDGILDGFPIEDKGSIKPVLFPPFCHRLLFGPRTEFCFPVGQFQADVLGRSDAPINAVAAKTKAPGAMGGRKGRPKGARNRSSSRGGGGMGARGGRGGGPPGSKRKRAGSALGHGRKDDDEDKHYGSDLEDPEQAAEDEEILARMLPEGHGGASRGGGGSGAPSTAGGGDTNGEDEEEGGADEAESDEYSSEDGDVQID